MRERLYRSNDSCIAGVCGGIAEWMGLPAHLVRFFFLIALLFWGASFWIYLLLAIFIPKPSYTTSSRGNYTSSQHYTYQARSQRKDKESEWDSRFHGE